MLFPIRVFLLAAVATCAAGPSARASENSSRSLSLDGTWLFQMDHARVGEKEGWQEPAYDRRAWKSVTVPGTWDSYESSLRDFEGLGWYAIAIAPEKFQETLWQRIRFDKVFHHAKVWFGGRLLGETAAGYVPLEFVIPSAPRGPEPQWLVVAVDNLQKDGWLPGTKIVEWVQYGGILESVHLLTTGRVYLEHLAIDGVPRSGGADVTATVRVANQGPAPFVGRVAVEVLAGGKSHATTSDVAVPAGSTSPVVLRLLLDRAQPWSPAHPVLNKVTAVLSADGKALDRLTDRFGIRRIEVRGRKLLLNGEPLAIHGVNRYDEFDRVGPMGSRAMIRADLASIKQMGANLIRVHYPQSPVHHELMDELGLLLMEEVPINWWRAAFHPAVPPARNNGAIIDVAEQALEAMVRRDRNHPSLIIWSMSNESQTADEIGVLGMERLLNKVHALDPSRPATYVTDRDQEKSRAYKLADLVAVNLYNGSLSDLAHHPSEMNQRVFEPIGDRLRTIAGLFPDKPILVAEFGAVGIRGTHGDTRSTEDFQAEYLKSAWRAIADVPDVIGGVIWSWADYRHRRDNQGSRPGIGAYGVVNIERARKRAYTEMARLWGGKP